MKRKYLEPALLGLILLGIIALAVYPYLRSDRNSEPPISSAPATSTPTPAKASNDKRYSIDTKELRAKFNHDKGKVRLILLLSPT